MAIPSKPLRDAWRGRVQNTPDQPASAELLELLDATDELEAENARLRRDALLAASLLDARGAEPVLADALRLAVAPETAPRGEALGSLEALRAAFDRHQDEYRRFDRMVAPPVSRPDLCAFLMLAALQPGTQSTLAAAEHDEVWLSVDCDALARVITDAEVRDLHRCGVSLCENRASLQLFV